MSRVRANTLSVKLGAFATVTLVQSLCNFVCTVGAICFATQQLDILFLAESSQSPR